MKSTSFLRMGLVVVMGFLVFSANADLDGAKKQLETVKKNITDDNTANIESDIKLVEFELKDVPDADKKPVADELDKIKKQILDTKIAKFKPGYTKSIESYLDSTKRDLAEGRPDITTRTFDSFDTYINKDEVKEIFTKEELDAYKAQMAKYRKTADDMMADANIDRLGTELDRLESDYATKVKELKEANEGQAQAAMRTIEQDLGSFTRKLGDVPADKPKVKAMKVRIDKLNADFATVGKGQNSKEQLERLKSFWESYSNEFGGWEQEKENLSIDRLKESNTDVWAFMMPKTKALISRADSYTENLNTNEQYKEVSSDPAIKAYVDGIAASRKTAYDKMLKNITGVVEQMEKLTYSNDNIGMLNSMSDNIRNALGEKSPDAPVLMARVKKLQDNYEAGIKAADKAFEDNYVKLKEEAAKAWPAMEAKYSVTTGFDPNKYKDFTGKTVRITTDNLMGWKFKADGSFPFATTLNGLPVACKYHPDVAAAIKDVEAKVKHGLGNIDEDGKWEIIATVDGTTGRMMTRRTVEGEVRSTGGERLGNYSEEKSEPVDAPILTIIAAKCGPLAVAAGQGSSAGGAAGVSGSTGWMRRIFVLLVGLVAAAAALMKANYAPLASIPQAGDVQAKLGGDNIAYIGLACAAFGVLWLLTGLIIYGLLVNVAIIAAGVYAAHEFLAAKGILKPDMIAKLKPLGVPIGLACAAIVVLSLFTGGSLWIL